MAEFLNNLWAFLTSPGFVIFGGITLIEIVPIKINPWGALLKWIGNVINAEDRKQIKELTDKVDGLEQDVRESKREREEDKAKQMRWRILDFANSCMHGNKHTREAWNHTIAELRDYEDYIERKDLSNGVIEETAVYLRTLYQENKRTNNFL